ncbi:hypothetical protein BKA70DRAFT_1417177 [Coprinopsis sp. MPI-PUGE-AT-0042]|nr:hypothetical protein BKA70DRAFT_1417177 [Coprinopsis sp. MPI-PUGE-AT-0042]
MNTGGHITPLHHSKSTNRSSKLPRFLFNSTFHFAVIRLVCVSALTVIAFHPINARTWYNRYDSTSGPYIEMAPMLVIFVHHVSSALGRHIFLPGGVDLALLCAEFGWEIFRLVSIKTATDGDGTAYTVAPGNTDAGLKTTFGVKEAIFVIAMGWIIVLLLGIVLILCRLRVYRAGWKGLITRVDVYSDNWIDAPSMDRTLEEQSKDSKSKHSIFKGSRTPQEGMPWWRYPRDILLGRSLWKPIIPGESRWTTIPRGAVASLGVLVLLPFIFSSLILEPCFELNRFPVREYRGVGLQENGFEISGEPVVLVVFSDHVKDKPKGFMASVVSVKAIHRTSEAFDEGGDNYNVTKASSECDWSEPEYPSLRMRGQSLLVYTCSAPDELIATFNASMFAPPLLLGIYFWAYDIEGTLEELDPTLFIPGSNLLALGGRPYWRERFRKATWSIFGWDDTQIFPLFPVEFLIPDPQVNGYGLASGESIATIRAPTRYERDGAVMRSIRDEREKSVLKGVSSVGGLGTFISAFCTFLFGTSLLQILLGHKPLSPFGLIHTLKRPRENIVSECGQKFAALQEEIEALERRPGILKFLLSTMIDINLIISGIKKHEESRRTSEDTGRDNEAESQTVQHQGASEDQDDGSRSLDDGGDFERIPLNQMTSMGDAREAV